MSQNTTIPPSDGLVMASDLVALTDSQERTMSLLTVFMSMLSLCGSTLIVYRILKNHSYISPYERIMLVLSCCDILFSIYFALSPFLLPADTSTRVWAIGNETTCNFLGFLQQFSFAAIWYNGILALYYFLTVRHGMKRQVFAKSYEPYLHSWSLVFFLATALSGVFVGLYGEMELGFGCWIKEYPENCEETDSCISQYLGWAYGGVPFLIVYLCLPFTNLSIYWYVRNTLGREGKVDQNRRLPEESQRYSPYQVDQIREVATQGFLYVGTFYFSYTVTFVLKIIESLDIAQESDIYPMLILNAMLPPLQGFFNALVYMRPHLKRLRAAFPGESKGWILKRAMVESDIPTLQSFAPRNSTPGGNNLGHNRQHKPSTNFNSELSRISESGESNLFDEEEEVSLQRRRRVLSEEMDDGTDAYSTGTNKAEEVRGYGPSADSVDISGNYSISNQSLSNLIVGGKLRRILMDGSVQSV